MKKTKRALVAATLLILSPALLADFSDEFDGVSLDPAWSQHNPQLFTLSLKEGRLEMDLDDSACSNTESGCVWYHDDTAGMLYQTMTGDFTAVTSVRARDQDDPSSSIDSDTQLTGLIVRDPASTSGAENYVFNVVGMRFDVASIEAKSTLNSSSSVSPFPWASTDAELRISREGDTFTLYARAEGATSWTLMETYVRPDLPQTLQIGLIGYTFHAYPENILAQFDYIRVSSPSSGGGENGGGGNSAPSAPASLSSLQQGSASIDLSWSAATDDGGVISSYRVYRQDAGLIATVAGTVLSYVDSGLSEGTSYTYWVTAVDAEVLESVVSPTVTVSTTSSSAVSLPITLFGDSALFAFSGGHGANHVSSISPDEGVGGSAAIKYSSILTGSFTRLNALDFSANPLDVSNLGSSDYLILSLDIGDVASPLSGVYLYFNDWPWNNAPSIELPEVDAQAGYQQMIIPLNGVRASLGNQLSLLLINHANWPVETLWVDQIQLVRTQDMHPVDAQRLALFGESEVNGSEAQAEGDYDGDGIMNFVEILQGSDPVQQSSYPPKAEVSVEVTESHYVFQLGAALEGTIVRVQASIDLSSWTDVASRSGTQAWSLLTGYSMETLPQGMWRLKGPLSNDCQFFRLKLEQVDP